MANNTRIYYATVTSEGYEPDNIAFRNLTDNHRCEGSPGGYLLTHECDNPMEATIFAFGLVAELAKDGLNFTGQITIYTNVYDGPDESPEAEELFGFNLTLNKVN
jgi:hypothetical protein